MKLGAFCCDASSIPGLALPAHPVFEVSISHIYTCATDWTLWTSDQLDTKVAT